MKYPNKCCRCGFCCFAETCPAGQKYYGIGKHDRCKGLFFFGYRSFCALVSLGLVPIGDGCCISARCFKDGKTYNYADLPKETKYRVVEEYKQQITKPKKLRSE
jgi:hypothetical protein